MASPKARRGPAPVAPPRPPFIVSTADVPEDDAPGYPGSSERLSHGRPIGKVAGLLRIGVHIERLPPGRRTSYPHAEQNEEELVFVLEGEVDAWIDGHLHRMKAGDLAAFPAGTGIAHTFLNDGDEDAVLLVAGEASRRESKIVYPLDPQRRKDLAWSQWWEGAPARPLGPHDGKPRARTASAKRRRLSAIAVALAFRRPPLLWCAACRTPCCRSMPASSSWVVA